MGDYKDIDVTGLIKRKSYAPLGDAHELYARAILMRLGFEVGKVDLSSGPYDLFIVGSDKPGGKRVFLRAQIKSISKASMSLTGGNRAGIDRTYKSSIKTYKYSIEHTDVILGVDTKELDIYVFPVAFAQDFKSSIGKGRMRLCKNNWDIFLNWNEGYLDSLKKQMIS